MSKFDKIVKSIQELRDKQLQKKEDLFLIQQEIERLEELLPKEKRRVPSPGKGTQAGSIKNPGKIPPRQTAPGKILGSGKPISFGPGKPGGPFNPAPGPIGGPSKTELLLQERYKQMKELKKELDQIQAALMELYQDLWTLGDPQELVKNWNVTHPVLLLPIKLETRFLTDPDTGDPLLGVRFFPDEIFVNTHEQTLTADEITAGKTFWQHLWDRLGDSSADQQDAHQGAWRALATSTGPNRAAHIILTTRPLNWPADTTIPPPTKAPDFPSLGYKNESWALPPRTYHMPDRFVVRLYRGTSERDIVGRPITAYPLILGPDPGSDEEFFEEDGGILKIDPAIKWLFDFETAIQVGMAVKIPLNSPEAKNGFDKILALGLRLTADTNESQKLCQKLINSHHYGLTGFGLLPQGTPTNNTKDNALGISSLRPDLNAAFHTERQGPLINSLSSTPKGEWKDGHWLSFGLGINESVLQHIPHADRSDRKEATAMNELLWPATLGYYFKHLLAHWGSLAHNTVSLPTMEELKTFFLQHVSARGPLPTIRVDKQPYGVLPVSAYSRMEWNNSDNLAKKINQAVRFFQASWSAKISSVKTIANGSSNWQQDFMDILGLHGGSVAFHHRLGIGPLLYYFFLSNANSSLNPNNWINGKLAAVDQNKLDINNLVSGSDLLSQQTRAAMLTWFPTAHPLQTDLITADPLSEIDPLGNDYIKYLSDLNKTPEIIKNYFNGTTHANTLLYHLLRHAFLLEIWEVLWEKDNGTKWIEKEYLNLFPNSPCDSIWYHYTNDAGEIEDSTLGELKSSSRYMNYLTGLQRLLIDGQSLPTARLERLLTEHLDVCSYRLDAWMTGLVDYRLQQMRAKHPKGTYLGAFGWLLDVRPEAPRTAVPATEIPSQLSNDGETYPLTYEPGNAGFIHAPSIAQATTGAVLRENYLSKNRQAMEVNISSRRIRLAREIIQGVTNGQELGALLGYRLERSLHEKSAEISGLELDKYIYQLRMKFPQRDSPDAGRNEAVEANQVIHGLNLLQAYRQGSNSVQAYLESSVTNTELQEIHNSIDELENIVDAVSDLTMAEGVHQTILGNHTRAGALLNAVGDGALIPDPEFIATPRTGIALTQRIGVFLKAEKQKAGWSSKATPRSRVAPYLNAWIGEALGKPGEIKCKVSYVKDNGNGSEFDTEVTMKDLALQPIDLVFLMNSQLEDGNSELAQRIGYQVREKLKLKKDILIRIDFRNRDNWKLSEKSLFEILPLARSIYRIVTESEVMTPEHLFTASSLDTDEEFVPKYDVKDLASRLKSLDLQAQLQDLSDQLAAVVLISDFSTKAAQNSVDELRRLVRFGADIGIQGAIPVHNQDFDTTTIDELKQQAQRVIDEMRKRVDQIAAITATLSTPGPDWVEPLVEALKIALGKEQPVLPRFQLSNFKPIKATYDERAALIRKATSPFVMEDWLQGTAKVREKVRNWQVFGLLTDNFQPKLDTGITALQLPYQKKDQWLGIPFEENEITISGDPISLVLNFPDGFIDKDDQYSCGLILDEWVEKIPYRSETTGISFNYEEPDAEPPQTLLLAVPPKISGKWAWEDLIDTLNETLETAKMRAVDPDLLGEKPGSDFNPFLPGLLSAVTTDHKQTVALNFSVIDSAS